MTAAQHRKTNPPIPGHKLLHEGRPDWHAVDPETENYLRPPPGGCECGAQPPGWPVRSINDTKRWHREHKAELRGVAS